MYGGLPCLSGGVIVDINPRITGIMETPNTAIIATGKNKQCLINKMRCIKSYLLVGDPKLKI